MEQITSVAELKESILLLELKLVNDGTLLKEQLKSTYQSIKPINLLKSAFKDVVSTPGLKTNLVNSAIGFTTGLVAKKLFIGGSHNPLTKLLGMALEAIVANKVSKNADQIKSAGSSLIKKIVNPK